ncbi:hypothetical protein OG884_20720 [Streptosporangium sp. NBC_01755]|uniref:hypothetical protein n=1 Tax=unclassified Streptosporangium TaxID=2632669 RepID=UPI002DD8B803|nr:MULTISPECIES: hypothetical protein [unclassified Streptosporangium]WSA24603.1 hypothetical protein OIE13_27195 [Streptosporangium sp. NBC_01810]WSC97321.1 hypothetical protein OG884_20720 [Streptosporangium sp. NBC_01755]
MWSPRFVTGLLGPLLSRPETLLVKGLYRRLFIAMASTRWRRWIWAAGGIGTSRCTIWE